LKHDMCRQCFTTFNIPGVQAVVCNEDFYVSTFFPNYGSLLIWDDVA
jgi:hypothetical protein